MQVSELCKLLFICQKSFLIVLCDKGDHKWETVKKPKPLSAHKGVGELGDCKEKVFGKDKQKDQVNCTRDEECSESPAETEVSSGLITQADV